MNDWDRMTIAAYRQRLAAGEVAPLDWWDTCRAHIASREPSLGAWTCLAPRPDTILPAGRNPLPPPLLGVPIGIKDIIDTRQLPTCWGTTYRRLESADQDAAIITRLASLGALVMGKTVTTEYAYFQPSGTRNPHDPGRTPGGSSSGSATAVAAGMVPVALGTQTVGSIIRPASYCGVVGFKPTHGILPLSGVKALAPSLDTLGWFTRTVADSSVLFQALTGANGAVPRKDLTDLRVGISPVPSEPTLAPEVQAALDQAAECMASNGATIIRMPPDPALDALVSHQQVILAYEAARALSSERACFGDEMSDTLMALLDEGERTPFEHYRASRQATEQARGRASALFSEQIDIMLAPSAPGVAPEGLDSTGDPLYSRAWTLLGGPCLNLPLHWTTTGLPVGVQLIADRYGDSRLLAVAGTLMA